MTGIRQHLQAIRDERGYLTPSLVVEVASDPKHPLHDRFEWNDTIAADKWRLEQAGQLLRVTFRPDADKPVDLRAFVAIKGEESPFSDYVPTGEVAADPFASDLLLRSMRRDWQNFKRRYDHMREFVGFVRGQVEDGVA